MCTCIYLRRCYKRPRLAGITPRQQRIQGLDWNGQGCKAPNDPILDSTQRKNKRSLHTCNHEDTGNLPGGTRGHLPPRGKGRQWCTDCEFCSSVRFCPGYPRYRNNPQYRTRPAGYSWPGYRSPCGAYHRGIVVRGQPQAPMGLICLMQYEKLPEKLLFER